MQKYHDRVQDVLGNAVTTASIYVYLAGTGTPATLKKDDESTALNNPITIADGEDYYDTKGNYGFKAANGIYDVKIVASDTTWRKERVLFDFSDDTSFGGNVSVGDGQHYYSGDSNDLDIFHDGNSRLNNNTGTFYMKQAVNSGLINLQSFNSAGTAKTGIVVGGPVPNVEFYSDGVKAAETRSGGIDIMTFNTSGLSQGQRIANGATFMSHDSTSSYDAIRFYNPNGQVGSVDVSGSATAYITSSDKRKKKSFGLVVNPFDILDNIEIHDAAFLADLDDRKMMVMSQDVEPHYPQATSHDEESDAWGVDYGQFSPLALACIKDLNERVKNLGG